MVLSARLVAGAAGSMVRLRRIGDGERVSEHVYE
jgi:hypothetical protein